MEATGNVITVTQVGDSYRANITTKGHETAVVEMGIRELAVPGESEIKAVGLLVCAHCDRLGIKIVRA